MEEIPVPKKISSFIAIIIGFTLINVAVFVFPIWRSYYGLTDMAYTWVNLATLVTIAIIAGFTAIFVNWNEKRHR
jgi:heme A synthase